DWRSIRAYQMMLVDANELATAQSHRLKQALSMIDSEIGRLDATNVADTEKSLRRYGDTKKNMSWEMVVIAERRVRPVVKQGTDFEPGIVVGRAYVYSHVEGAVVCAANVLAHSSKLLPSRSYGQNDDGTNI